MINIGENTISEFYIGDTLIPEIYLGDTPTHTPDGGGLTFVSQEADCSVALNKVGSPTSVSIEYTTDNGDTWSAYTFGSSISLPTAGSRVALRNVSESATSFSTSENDYYNFSITGEVSAKREITYLIRKDGNVTDLSSYSYCFYKLFNGCSGLTNAPSLPAKVLGDFCYYGLFSGCSSLSAISCMATNITASNSTTDWVYGVSETGTFRRDANMIMWELDSDNGVPSNWDLIPPVEKGLKFVAEQDDSSVALNKEGNPTSVVFEYTTDGYNWLPYTVGTSISLVNAGDTVKFRNTSTTTTKFSTSTSDYYKFNITGKCNVSDDISYLINRNGNVNTLPNNYCFYRLFGACTGLSDASSLILPATRLTDCCYLTMLSECTSLTAAPELPATQLAKYCYQSMFYGCRSLTAAPELPATQLAYGCYYYMFYGCRSLTAAPELPATTLAEWCYYGMFIDCRSLTVAPELPATQLADTCYQSMFNGCWSLTVAPELPATTLANSCYTYMFYECHTLTSITCLATDITANNCIKMWTLSVSSTGTFIKNPSMNDWTIGADGIPNGWTVEDYIED